MEQFLALVKALAALEPIVVEVADLLAKAVPGNQVSALIEQVDKAVSTLRSAVDAHNANSNPANLPK